MVRSPECDFGLPMAFVAVGALPHVQLAALEVDVLPAQAAQLARSQAGKGRCHQQRAKATGSGVEDALDLLPGRDVDADLEPALAALVDADGDVSRYVLGDVAAPLRILEQRLEAGEHLLGRGARHARQQLVAEGIDTRRRQPRQLLPTEPRLDVQLDVLAVVLDGGALAPLQLDEGEPLVRGLRNGDGPRRGCVGPSPHVDPDLLRMGVSVLLAVEGLDVAGALRVEVVDDPRLLRLPAARRPFPLANRHCCAALV